MAGEPVCPKCEGAGWVIVERAGVSGAEPCDCRYDGRAERMEDRAQIPPLYRKACFENFLLPEPGDPARPGLENALLGVKRFVQDFPRDDRPGLLIVGGIGTGKTHLAVAALRKIVAQKGFEGLFCNYQGLLERIREGYEPASNSSPKEAYRAALEADVLLLDDLGANRVTSWVEDIVTSIVTWRCDNRKPLIATTNLPDPDLGNGAAFGLPNAPEYRETLAERIGPRARSRLFEMCAIIRMPAMEDYRIQKARPF